LGVAGLIRSDGAFEEYVIPSRRSSREGWNTQFLMRFNRRVIEDQRKMFISLLFMEPIAKTAPD
jgi:hypothetical protein